MKKLILLASLFLSTTTFADTCWDDFKQHTDRLMLSREVQYRFLDLSFKELAPQAKAYTLDGEKNELVMLIHGFLGNPSELKTVADMMNKAGYHVYSGLIPGFGATAQIANRYTKEQWLRWNRREIKRAGKCFSKIHLIGFSTGGTIFHDYVSSYPEDTNIASVTFMSAFFKYRPEFEGPMQLARVSGIQTVDLAWVFKNVPVPDARVIIENPDVYLQHAPIRSMFEVVDLGRINHDRKLAQPLTVPAQAVISMEDWVSDPSNQIHVLKDNFSDLELRTFFRPGHVPHQVMLESVSQVSDQVHMAIIDFIQRH